MFVEYLTLAWGWMLMFLATVALIICVGVVLFIIATLFQALFTDARK